MTRADALLAIVHAPATFVIAAFLVLMAVVATGWFERTVDRVAARWWPTEDVRGIVEKARRGDG